MNLGLVLFQIPRPFTWYSWDDAESNTLSFDGKARRGFADLHWLRTWRLSSPWKRCCKWSNPATTWMLTIYSSMEDDGIFLWQNWHRSKARQDIPKSCQGKVVTFFGLAITQDTKAVGAMSWETKRLTVSLEHELFECSLGPWKRSNTYIYLWATPFSISSQIIHNGRPTIHQHSQRQTQK